MNKSLINCIHITASEIFGLASQFATQNCLSCYSKLNLGKANFTQKLLIASLSHKN